MPARVDGVLVVGVPEEPPRPSRRIVLVAPGGERADSRPQGRAPGGQFVLLVTRPGRHPGQHPDGCQRLQPPGQHRAGDPPVCREVAEPADTEERVPHDQQGLPLADHFEGAGQAWPA